MNVPRNTSTIKVTSLRGIPPLTQDDDVIAINKPPGLASQVDWIC